MECIPCSYNVLATSSYTRPDQQKYCSLNRMALDPRFPDQLEIGPEADLFYVVLPRR
jgi:hypothetical protein